MRRFSNFADDELDVMEETFCNEGLNSLACEVRREREYRESKRAERAEDSDNWAYSIFDKDRIKAYKERWTKEAEERGMTLIEYLESIDPLKIEKSEKNREVKIRYPFGNENI